MKAVCCSFLLCALITRSIAFNVKWKGGVKYIWSPIVLDFGNSNLSANNNGLPENVEPSYYGYSFKIVFDTNVTARTVIGSPKSIHPTNSSLHLHQQPEVDYSGNIQTCGPITTDWFSSNSTIDCESAYPPDLRPGDNFGIQVPATPEGDILACSPTREQICGDLTYTPGVCYKSKDWGKTWEEEGTTRSLTCPTTKTVDVLFVLDGSASVGQHNFETVKEWVKTITKILDIRNTTSVGVVQYSHYYKNQPLNGQSFIVTHIKIGKYSSYEKFAEEVDAIKLQGYTTYTGRALQKVAFDFKETKNFNKTTNKQVMILLTDGEPTDPEIVPSSAQALRDLGVITYAVGVGRYQAYLNQLRIVATGNTSDDTRVLTVSDFSGLDAVAKTLQAEIQSITLEGGGLKLENKELGLAGSFSKTEPKRVRREVSEEDEVSMQNVRVEIT